MNLKLKQTVIFKQKCVGQYIGCSMCSYRVICIFTDHNRQNKTPHFALFFYLFSYSNMNGLCVFKNYIYNYRRNVTTTAIVQVVKFIPATGAAVEILWYTRLTSISLGLCLGIYI